MIAMTMLTHMRAPFERTRTSPVPRAKAGADAVRMPLATIKRFLISALTVAAAGVALVAIMALKIAVYLPRVMHH
jgi:hypothetical protein